MSNKLILIPPEAFERLRGSTLPEVSDKELTSIYKAKVPNDIKALRFADFMRRKNVAKKRGEKPVKLTIRDEEQPVNKLAVPNEEVQPQVRPRVFGAQRHYHSPPLYHETSEDDSPYGAPAPFSRRRRDFFDDSPYDAPTFSRRRRDFDDDGDGYGSAPSTPPPQSSGLVLDEPVGTPLQTLPLTIDATLKTVRSAKKNSTKRLYEFFQTNDNITWDAQNQLVYNGETIPGADFRTVIKDLNSDVELRNSKLKPRVRDVINVLRTENVPHGAIGNPHRKDVLLNRGRIDDETPRRSERLHYNSDKKNKSGANKKKKRRKNQNGSGLRQVWEES